MAKLTRMQKYAAVRDQMAHDREATHITDELSEYEDKLKSIQDIAKEDGKFEKSANDEQEDVPSFETIQKEYSLEKEIKEVEKESDSFLDFLASLDADDIDNAIKKTINSSIDDIKEIGIDLDDIKVAKPFMPGFFDDILVTTTPEKQVAELEKPLVDQEPKNNETPIVAPININVDIEPIKKEETPNIDDLISEINDIDENIEVPVEDVKQDVVETPVEEPVKEQQPIQEETPVIEPEISVAVETPIFEEEIQDKIPEEINMGVESPIAEFAEPVTVINNDYINKALEEVNNYNKMDGRKDVNDISNMMIENIRHPENNQPKPVNKDKKEESTLSDEEFSNTVTLEIDKVLNEIKKEALAKAPEVKIEKPVANIEVKPEEYAEKIANSTEHVKTPSNPKDEPVEIKTLEETMRQEALDTIRFNVDDVDDDLDEYEDDAPNKVLNVILIILIIILVAILGVIVYYILFAKEII